jgi:hypothetical protein
MDKKLLEKLILTDDLSRLTPQERADYYLAVCERLGLDPLLKPLAFLHRDKVDERTRQKSTEVILYALRGATEQLRQQRGITIDIVSRERLDNVYIVVARGTLPDGRRDEAIGASPLVSSEGKELSARSIANAIMGAETKAKRRVTLSLCGLGMLDESETDTMPEHVREDVVLDQRPPTQPVSAEPAPKPDEPRAHAPADPLAPPSPPPPTAQRAKASARPRKSDIAARAEWTAKVLSGPPAAPVAPRDDLLDTDEEPPSELDEQRRKVMLASLRRMAAKVGSDEARIAAHYGVKSLEDLDVQQLDDAMRILAKKALTKPTAEEKEV